MIEGKPKTLNVLNRLEQWTNAKKKLNKTKQKRQVLRGKGPEWSLTGSSDLCLEWMVPPS